jgi:hypothetical protein
MFQLEKLFGSCTLTTIYDGLNAAAEAWWARTIRTHTPSLIL